MHATSCATTLLRGLAAGVIAGFAQNQYFKRTGRLAPGMPPDAFAPPDPMQERELPTATVARRLVEDFMRRGPLSERAKARGATLVHYSYAAMWGGLWGGLRESYPRVFAPESATGYGVFIWAVSYGAVLPAFELSAWPQRYPLRNHLYAIGAHLAYGWTLAGAYELLRRLPVGISLAVLTWQRGLARLPIRRRAAERVMRRVRESAAELLH